MSQHEAVGTSRLASPRDVTRNAWVQGLVAMRYNRFEVVSQSASPTSDGSE